MKKLLLFTLCSLFALSGYSQNIMSSSSSENSAYSSSLRWTTPPRLNLNEVLLVSSGGGDQVFRGTRTTLQVYYLPADQGINRFEWHLGSWQQYVIGYGSDNGIRNGLVYLRLDNNAAPNQLIEVVAYNSYGAASLGRMMYATFR